jgi:hypothetical protein
MDGFQLYESLKKIDPDVKACFLTASEMYYGVHRGVEHCALKEDLFLQKPIDWRPDKGSKTTQTTMK